MDIKPVILCGGSGTRLWPLSRQTFPKQFQSLEKKDKSSLLQKCVQRATSTSNQKVLLLCNEEHRFIVAEQLRQINHLEQSDILLEPTARNTAASIATVALLTKPTDVLLIMPSDHFIPDEIQFASSVKNAGNLARRGLIITFGIKPLRPATCYGYIKTGKPILGTDGLNIKKFVEKPDSKTANKFMEQEGYLWNSGIFCAQAKTLIAEFESHAPEILNYCRASIEHKSKKHAFTNLGKKEFAQNPQIAFDHAIMEKTKKAAVIPYDHKWSDLGQWSALWEIAEKDPKNNCLVGDVVEDECSGCYLNSEHYLLAASNVKDLVVVAMRDAVLVTSLDESSNIKSLVAKIKNRPETTNHSQSYRPWGYYEVLVNAPGHKVKRIVVKPKQKLSLQYHHHRSEHWVVVRGIANVHINGEDFELQINQSTYIPLKAVHSLANFKDEELEIIEVQIGNYLEEDDIVRLDDKYGRS